MRHTFTWAVLLGLAAFACQQAYEHPPPNARPSRPEIRAGSSESAESDRPSLEELRRTVDRLMHSHDSPLAPWAPSELQEMAERVIQDPESYLPLLIAEFDQEVLDPALTPTGVRGSLRHANLALGFFREIGTEEVRSLLHDRYQITRARLRTENLAVKQSEVALTGPLSPLDESSRTVLREYRRRKDSIRHVHDAIIRTFAQWRDARLVEQLLQEIGDPEIYRSVSLYPVLDYFTKVSCGDPVVLARLRTLAAEPDSFLSRLRHYQQSIETIANCDPDHDWAK